MSDLVLREQAEARGWGKLAVESILLAVAPGIFAKERDECAVSAARAAWRHALLYDAAREGRLFE